MTYSVITASDLGTGLKVEQNKVVVDVAALNIPIDVKLAGVNVDKVSQTMEFVLSDGAKVTTNIADFLMVDTDTKVKSGSYADGSITLTLTDESTVAIDLATLKSEITSAYTQAVSAVDSKVTQLTTRVETLENAKLTGTEVRSLAGDTLGYLVNADHMQKA